MTESASVLTGEYLPGSQAAELERYRGWARWFDAQWRIPFTQKRFGLDPLLGLIPVVGDLISAAFAAYGIVIAQRLGAPRGLQLRMLGNILLDAVGGGLPVVGDIFDVAFRAHRRNLHLLDAWLATPRR
jgi:hypothetical protein